MFSPGEAEALLATAKAQCGQGERLAALQTARQALLMAHAAESRVVEDAKRLCAELRPRKATEITLYHIILYNLLYITKML